LKAHLKPQAIDPLSFALKYLSLMATLVLQTYTEFEVSLLRPPSGRKVTWSCGLSSLLGAIMTLHYV